MAHKEFPKQSAAVILNHDSYRPLVDGKITLRIPVVRFAESVVESVRAEHLVAHVVKVRITCSEYPVYIRWTKGRRWER